jgi:cation diffusion facilitator family transporter
MDEEGLRRRARMIVRALLLSTAVNVSLGVFEIYLAQVTGNNGLFMVGVVNFLCFVPGVMSIASVRMGTRQADWRMQYGYRRIETAMVFLFSIVVCGVAVQQLVDTVVEPSTVPLPQYGAITAAYALCAIAIEYLLSGYLWKIGKEQDSKLLILDAIMLRGDMIISGIILVGGALLATVPEFMMIQTGISLVVILIIFAFGLKEAIGAIKELVDAAPSLKVIGLIEKLVEEDPNVVFISEQRMRTFGGALSVELTVEIDPSTSVEEAYAISNRIEGRIRSEIENVLEVRVRTHPAGAFARAWTSS